MTTPNQDDANASAFADLFGDALRKSLQVVDGSRDALDRERLELTTERDAVRAARIEAEREGERIAMAYFNERREQLIVFTRQEVLRELAMKHLQAGASAGAVVEMLDADPAFVQRLADLLKRTTHRSRASFEAERLPALRSARVSISTAGRGGTIHYADDRNTLDMWWEFAMQPALVLVGIPTAAEWEVQTKMPLSEREQVLGFIAEQLIVDHTQGVGHYELAGSILTIYSGS